MGNLQGERVGIMTVYWNYALTRENVTFQPMPNSLMVNEILDRGQVSNMSTCDALI